MATFETPPRTGAGAVPNSALVREELVRLLESPELTGSAQLKALLRYIVEAAIEGRTDELKEAILGVAVFNKAPGYDQQESAIVRTSAWRLRGKLEAYYAGRGAGAAIRIELPKGSYVPVFVEAAKAPEPAPDEPPRRKHKWTVMVAAAAVAVLAGAAFAFFAPWNTPQVVSITQLTFDGVDKGEYLMTDGLHLYFNEAVSVGEVSPMRIPLAKADPERTPLPSAKWRFLDVNDRSEFLLLRMVFPRDYSLWKWIPDRAPIRLMESGATDAVWLGSSRLAVSTWTDVAQQRAQLSVVTPAGVRRNIPMPGSIEGLSWEPKSQRLRFTLSNPRTDQLSLWEMHSLTDSPRPIRDLARNAFDGTWSRDGSLFVFTSMRPNTTDRHDLWAIDERLGRSHRPVKLNSGQLDFSHPVPSADGKQIFAIGKKEHGELVRYDVASRRFVRFLGGLYGVETDFSPDGKWVAYVDPTEKRICKVRLDGTERDCLTAPPMDAVGPHWSPDGERIAFVGILGDRWRIYVVPAAGGKASAVADGGTDQGIPTWSPDGRRLVYGEVLYRKPQSKMSIHVLDLATSAVETLPGSEGLWSPRWSPDGKYIAATTADYRELRLFDTKAAKWETLLQASWIEHVAWTRDSGSIHFMALGVPLGRGAPAESFNSLYRIGATTRKLERLVKLDQFMPATPVWYGVMPDGSPLALRRVSTDDIYALVLNR